MKKIAILFMMTCTLLMITACTRQNETDPDMQTFQIYEVNKEDTVLSAREFDTTEKDTAKLVELMISNLREIPTNTDLRPAIPDYVELLNYNISQENVLLNFSGSYTDLSSTGEVLTRAAIVRTLTQIPDVKCVTFMVDGSALTNKSGAPVGIMTAEQFIDNTGDEINTQEEVTLCLYFANEKGDKLIKVNRTVQYSSNISLEKLVMEQLIDGVEDKEQSEWGVYPVINPETKLISVSVSDGTCYVNMDNSFLTQIYNTSPDVTLYSIVNSLAELADVNKVQISVEGSSEGVLKEVYPLSVRYERNLELIQGE